MVVPGKSRAGDTQMTTVTEKTETAAATAEPKATTKPSVGARAAHVAPPKRKAGKKAAAVKAAPRAKTNASPAKGKKTRPAHTAYERMFRGKAYTLLTVERDGQVAFQLKGGKMFPSLTAAAKSVTGYKAISGPAFWAPPKKAAAK
jgi:hypothetical protein